MEWTKDALLRHNFRILTVGTLVTIDYCIVLVYIPSMNKAEEV
jgi:hypothetical protein